MSGEDVRFGSKALGLITGWVDRHGGSAVTSAAS
jgi:hypothetical protein